MADESNVGTTDVIEDVTVEGMITTGEITLCRRAKVSSSLPLNAGLITAFDHLSFKVCVVCDMLCFVTS